MTSKKRRKPLLSVDEVVAIARAEALSVYQVAHEFCVTHEQALDIVQRAASSERTGVHDSKLLLRSNARARVVETLDLLTDLAKGKGLTDLASIRKADTRIRAATAILRFAQPFLEDTALSLLTERPSVARQRTIFDHAVVIDPNDGAPVLTIRRSLSAAPPPATIQVIDVDED